MAYILQDFSEKDSVGGSFEELTQRFPDVNERLRITRLFSAGTGIVPPIESPRELRLRGFNKKLPCAFWVSGLTIIAQKPVKDLIEEFDPRAHQFLPIDIVDCGNVPVKIKCFILNVTVRRDTIIDEQSDVEEYTHKYHIPDGTMQLRRDPKRVVISRHAIDGVHLWREARYMGKLMMTESLSGAITSRGLSFLEMMQVAETA